MKDILQEIVANKRKELEARYNSPKMKSMLTDMIGELTRKPVSISSAIEAKNLAGQPGIIAEFKRRSPSKGDIAPGADLTPVVKAYEDAGAAACSVLTDTRFFGGALSDLSLARTIVEIPVLRKDFIIDIIQIYEAYLAGADALLLIASCLNRKEIENFTRLAHDLNMEVLLEIHDESETDKIIPEADMIGVNNRALSSFHTDVNHSAKLIRNLPENCVKIAESGIKTPDDIRRLRDVGYSGFLIGETFMRAQNIKATLKEFVNVG